MKIIVLALCKLSTISFLLNGEVCKPNTIKQWWSRTSKVSNLFKTEIIFIGIAGFFGKSFSRGIGFNKKGTLQKTKLAAKKHIGSL